MQFDPTPEIERGAQEASMRVRLLQDWLGHPGIKLTRWYSRTSAKRFGGVWNWWAIPHESRTLKGCQRS
jgi:hypothetical protein